METKDSNGNVLEDAVPAGQAGRFSSCNQRSKSNGMSKTLKRGNIIKNIRLTSNPQEVECRIGKSQIVLKTQFLKKA